MMNEQQALTKLRDLIAADEDPVLTDAQVSGLLSDAARATVYAADTAYDVGDTVILSPSIGRIYQCIVAGTTDPVTAPSWPDPRAAVMDQQFSEGVTAVSTLVWQDAGPAWPELWDMGAAAKAGWLRKAAMLTPRIDIADKDVKLALTQLRDNCLSQARYHDPVWVF